MTLQVTVYRFNWKKN